CAAETARHAVHLERDRHRLLPFGTYPVQIPAGVQDSEKLRRAAHRLAQLCRTLGVLAYRLRGPSVKVAEDGAERKTQPELLATAPVVLGLPYQQREGFLEVPHRLAIGETQARALGGRAQVAQRAHIIVALFEVNHQLGRDLPLPCSVRHLQGLTDAL